MCGEKQIPEMHASRTRGSPPRVRGKGTAIASRRSLMGITPACAGKRSTERGCTNGTEDHPRVCGEKCVSHTVAALSRGSPPRVRGKGSCDDVLNVALGITPACAGKSIAGSACGRAAGDHPRVCGEKCALFSSSSFMAGSPPRVRGKACWIAPNVLSPRITPACAGKRLVCFEYPGKGWDHPRVCGEKTKKIP